MGVLKQKIGAMTNTIITKLPSVGSAISSTGLIYSVNINDSIDFKSGPVDVEDADSEWFESLDQNDAETVNDIITNNSN